MKTAWAGLSLIRPRSGSTQATRSISGNSREPILKVPGTRAAGSKSASTAHALTTFRDLRVVSPRSTQGCGGASHPVSSVNSRMAATLSDSEGSTIPLTSDHHPSSRRAK